MPQVSGKRASKKSTPPSSEPFAKKALPHRMPRKPRMQAKPLSARRPPAVFKLLEGVFSNALP